MDSDQAQSIGSTCLVLHVRRAARQMSRLYDQALRAVDLSNGQFSLMTTLVARPDWGMQQLADALGIDQSSLTAALKPLKRRRLVEERADDNDRRVRRLRLTPEGQALLDEAEPLWRDAQDKAEAALGRISANNFRRQLRAIG